MRFLRAAIAAALLCVPLSLSPSALAETESVLGQREVEEALTCQCGCGLTVATCNHLECSFAVPVRKDVAESLARGETGEQILERYKKEYGEKVLSSPIPEGFNLLAWIGPYLGIAVAGFAMFAFFRSRPPSDPPSDPPASGSTTSGPGSDDRLAQLRHEVEELEEVTAFLAVVLVAIVAAFIVSPFLAQRAESRADGGPPRDELWKREKAVAVLAITEADFDLATGKLSDADYHVLRSDYEGRALHAMDEMDRLAPAADAAETARFCAGCGTPFDSSDAFCGACGRPRFGRV